MADQEGPGEDGKAGEQVEQKSSLPEFTAPVEDTADKSAIIQEREKEIQEEEEKRKIKKKKDDTLEHTIPKIEMSVKQKKDIQDAFDAFDSQGTGQMDAKDLKVALRAMGFEPKKNEIKRLIAMVDKGNTKKLTFGDFMNIINFKMVEKDSRDEIFKAFKLFDRDKTGKITFENLQAISLELGEGLNDEEVKEMIAEADLNNDGKVDQAEFFRIMKKTSLY